VAFWQILECTEFVFGQGFTPDPAGELSVPPDPLAGLRWTLLLRGEEGKKRKRVGEKEGKGGEK